MPRRASPLVIAVLALLSLSSAAHAGTVEVKFVRFEAIPPEPKGGSGGSYPLYELAFTSAPGETSELSVSTVATTPSSIAMSDKTAPLSPGEGCRSDAGSVVCSPAPGGVIGTRTFDLGDGDDVVTFFGTAATAKLGPGDDRVRAEFPVSTTFGVTVDGGPGADTMDADASGRITASYGDRTAGIVASLDGVANDGEPGEGDQLGPGVIGVAGGSGPDAITGGARDDFLYGGRGNDTILGVAGKDFLSGNEGDDTVDGGAGDETFYADPGADVVRGGAGTDRMSYDRGDDKSPVSVTLDDQRGDGVPGENDDIGADVENLSGAAGDDRLVGSDGPNELVEFEGNDYLDGRGGDDTLTGGTQLSVTSMVGGAGRDGFLLVGRFDKVAAADGEADRLICADRGIAPIEGDAIDTGTGCIDGFDVPSNKRRLAVDRRGRIRVRVGCEDNSVTCVGRIALVARDTSTRRGAGRVLARANLTATNDEPRVVRLTLSRRALRYLRAHPKLKATAAFTTRRTLPAETRTHSQAVSLIRQR